MRPRGLMPLFDLLSLKAQKSLSGQQEQLLQLQQEALQQRRLQQQEQLLQLQEELRFLRELQQEEFALPYCKQRP